MFNLQDIEKIDLENISLHIEEEEFRKYFTSSPGIEHYKLLAYISTTYTDSILLDVGTYKGCSALALSYNQRNVVKSFDLYGKLRINYFPSNIKFIIGDITNNIYVEDVKKSSFILLDTEHDGVFENLMYKYLKDINWRGHLMLDDIKLNTEMISFWNSILEEKHDISNLGHHSGTGLVVFK